MSWQNRISLPVSLQLSPFLSHPTDNAMLLRIWLERSNGIMNMNMKMQRMVPDNGDSMVI